MPMNSHNIRVSDDVWQSATARAASEHTNVSELVRTWLSDYADSGVVKQPRLSASKRKTMRKVLDTKLSDRELNIIKMRFGLESGKSHTLEEIGQKYAVTRERIRQIEAKAITKLLGN